MYVVLDGRAETLYVSLDSFVSLDVVYPFTDNILASAYNFILTVSSWYGLSTGWSKLT